MSKALLDALAVRGMSVSDFKAAFMSCVDEGVTERPPQPGQSYKAFVVHPSKPGPQTSRTATRLRTDHRGDATRSCQTLPAARRALRSLADASHRTAAR
jgi:hypothetical protein